MSAAHEPEIHPSTKEKAIETLSELADLFCKTHSHEITSSDLAPGETAEGYCMTIRCSENDIAWKVQMWKDCRLRAIIRCRKVPGLIGRSTHILFYYDAQ